MNFLESFLQYKKDWLIGVDEVGRGPIAGPVTVAAFAVHRDALLEVYKHIEGITDSKKITEKRRDIYAEKIKSLLGKDSLRVAITAVSAFDIDRMGIIRCIQSALDRSLVGLKIAPQDSHIFLDGGLCAGEEYVSQETIIKGDAKNWLIGAASVVAKVSRDKQMISYGEDFPNYGFERHKGYGTKAHYAAIAEIGPCELHRLSWLKLD